MRILYIALTYIRRPLRGHRHALFPPLRLPLRLPDSLHPPRHISRPQRQIGKHAVDPLLPRALPARTRWHPVPLPESFVDKSRDSTSLDQVTDIEHSLGESRWQAGLGDQPATGTSGVDGAHAEPEAAVQCQAGGSELGKHIYHRTRITGAGRKWPDLPSPSQGW
jgi:hypothetical protein